LEVEVAAAQDVDAGHVPGHQVVGAHQRALGQPLVLLAGGGLLRRRQRGGGGGRLVGTGEVLAGLVDLEQRLAHRSVPSLASELKTSPSRFSSRAISRWASASTRSSS